MHRINSWHPNIIFERIGSDRSIKPITLGIEVTFPAIFNKIVMQKWIFCFLLVYVQKVLSRVFSSHTNKNVELIKNHFSRPKFKNAYRFIFQGINHKIINCIIHSMVQLHFKWYDNLLLRINSIQNFQFCIKNEQLIRSTNLS